MLSRDKVIEIFCIADDSCKEFDSNMKEMTLKVDGKRHRNRKAGLSDAEIMTILICFHFGSFRCLKHYYLHYVQVHLPDMFPTAVSYNRFVELESRVSIQMMLFLQLLNFEDNSYFLSYPELRYMFLNCILHNIVFLLHQFLRDNIYPTYLQIKIKHPLFFENKKPANFDNSE